MTEDARRCSSGEEHTTRKGVGQTVDGQSAEAMGRRQVRGSSLLLLGRAASMVLALATQVIIVRALSKAEFGGFAYALALATAGRTFLSLGQGRLLSRFMAMYEEQRDYARMFGAMFLAAGTILATSVVCIGALYVFTDPLVSSAVDSRQAVRLVLILVFLSPLEALDQVFVSLFAVFSRPRAIFVRKYLLAPGLRLVVVLLLVALDAGVVFLAVGYLVASVLGLFLYVGLLVAMLRERGLLHQFRARHVILPFRAVFSFSVPLITGELLLLSLTTGSVVILGWFHSVVEVADYRAVFNSARLNTAVQQAFATLFLPLIARLYERRDIEGLRRTYWQTAGFVAVLTFPVFALTGPLAPQTTVILFGDRYAESSSVMAMLAVGYYFNVVLGFNAYALQVCGRIRYLVWVNVAMIVTNLGLCLVLADRYGADGAAAANLVTLVAQNLLNQWALRYSIRTGFIGRANLGCYASIVGWSLALWLFSWGLDPGFVWCLVAASLASLAVLVGSSRTLEMAQTFPELRRIPGVRRLIR